MLKLTIGLGIVFNFRCVQGTLKAGHPEPLSAIGSMSDEVTRPYYQTIGSLRRCDQNSLSA